jgi:hypothetical protein
MGKLFLGRAPRAEFNPVFVAEERPANVTALRISGGDELPNEDPVTDERYRRWYATADLRVRLEVQLGQQSHLRDLLRMSEEREDRFFQRFGIGGVGPGESADLQLRMYQAVRERLQRHLVVTDSEVNGLREQIARISGARDTSTQLGDRTMQDKPLADCGFEAAQVVKLEKLGIRTARDFALQFYLPQQHETAAVVLGVDLAEAQRLVRQTANEVSEEELDELVREARRPHEFGVLPPNLDNREKRQ